MPAQGSGCIAVLDTCVLAPMPLCDTLLRLAEDPPFYTPRWSDDILRELRSTLVRMGYSDKQATRRISAMTVAFENAKIKGYQGLISLMTNDLKDRHVLAAAIKAGAQGIVTSNVKDFPAASVAPFGVQVWTPDAFLTQWFRGDRKRVVERLTEQAEACGWHREELLLRLGKTVPAFADLWRREIH